MVFVPVEEHLSAEWDLTCYLADWSISDKTHIGTEVRMKPVANKTKKPAARKTTAKKKAASSILSMCPVDGAGWCPYPFSTAQLKKRLKRLQEESQEMETRKAPKGKKDLSSTVRTK